ncbi:MAG: transcriptional regulator, Crp [Proteobacteria bacterium]|nr:transcriptional regulator, Crp [Pseudomonadota bacterium]
MTTLNRTHKCNGRSNCFTCSLRSTMVCADVSLEDLLAFHTPIDDLVFEKDAIIYNMTDRASAVYCVRHGVIKLVRYDVSGNQRIVRFLKKNDVVALESVFSEEQQHTAIALTEAHLCRIPMAHFRQFIAEHPALQLRLLEKSQEALRDADNWLSELVSNTVPAKVRLARLLLQLRIGESDRVHRLSIADFGAILGIAPETVSRLLNELMDGEILMKAGRGPNGRNYRADMPALTLISQDGCRARQTRKTY